MIDLKFQIKNALSSQFFNNIWTLILICALLIGYLATGQGNLNPKLMALAIFLVVLTTLIYLVNQIFNSIKQLVTEQARVEASLNSLNIGFLIFDHNLKIKSINAAAKRMIYPDQLNSTASGILHSVDWLTNRHQHQNTTQDVEFEWQIIKQKISKVLDLDANLKACLAEGKTIKNEKIPYNNLFLNIFVTPIINYKNTIKVIGVVVLIEDITERELVERSKDDFFSIASHELRTPLTTIRGNTSLIKDYFAEQIKNPDLKEMVDDIHESSVRLIDLVNDFLDTSRLEQGRIEFKKEPFSIKELAGQVIRELENLAKEKNVYLKDDIDVAVSPVFADKMRTKQVLINLINNGIKFTERGGVNIWAQKKDNEIMVFVHDTGRGIGENDQKLLFRKFQQANDNPLIRDSKRSTGLGLYISKLMVEGMGGSIRLEHSEPNKGSIFSFSLPIAENQQYN